MTAFIVVYDACVLYPAPLRDLLMHLALTDLFRARWSRDIEREWIENLLKKRKDLSRERLERTAARMNEHLDDALITHYELLIPALQLPDPDDRHVLAAALKAGASVILTFNLTDFPKEVLRSYGIEAQHPDEFVLNLLNLNQGAVIEAVRNHFFSLRHPPKTFAEYLQTLQRQGLPETAHALSGFAGLF